MESPHHIIDPMARPQTRELLEQFRRQFGLREAGDIRQQLRELASAFAALPYENLTKIIKDSESVSHRAARRGPHEVLGGFLRWGAGGTCFSLTATLLHLVRSLGVEAEPILADRRYGVDTHCALVVWLDGQPHLLDPGYLITDPLPLSRSGGILDVATRFNQLQLVPRGAGQIELHTMEGDHRRHRLTFKTSPVDATQFRRAWDASFDWDMMHYPLLTRVTADQQVYLRGCHLQKRSLGEVVRELVPEDDLVVRIGREFRISPEVVKKALQVLQREGDQYGPNQSR
jgi:arylamine N-acetyltransferase